MSLTLPKHAHSEDKARVSLAAVVVNYNYARFVGEAVRSVLQQAQAFDEIVVVDDGSTDESLSVLGEFGDSIRVVEKTNGGQLSAVFAAIAVCQSDYVYVLDADDIAAPELVQTVAQYLDPTVVKFQFQLRSMDSNGNPIDSVFPSYADQYSEQQMAADNERLGFYVCPPTSGNVFRRDYLESLSRDALNQREAFDGVPAQLAPYFGRVISLNEPLARYRVHDDSDSKWGSPTPQLLRAEIDRYRSRWDEVSAVLSARGMTAATPQESAYTTERELMIQVLESRRPSLRLALTFARQLSGSSLAKAQRVSLAAWALALTVAPRRTSRNLVISRRSARERSRIVKLIARLVRA